MASLGGGEDKDLGEGSAASSFPVKTEYRLTESGLEIIDVIKELRRWALKWKVDTIACGNQDCRMCVV